MAADDQDGRVVEFSIRRREASEEELGRLARAPRPACSHPRFVVDDKQRTVQCGACGAWLDPVWCLLAFLERDERVEARIAYMLNLEREQEARRERAIARRAAAAAKAKQTAAAENCGACDGTGWIQARAGGGVIRCECRRTGARLV